KQSDLILAHVSFDRQRDELPRARQFLQRARGALYEVTHAVDVENDVVLAVTVDDAFELADHARASAAATLSTRLRRRCAWHTAIASASAASSDCGSAFGSSTPIIMRICAFSQ